MKNNSRLFFVFLVFLVSGFSAVAEDRDLSGAPSSEEMVEEGLYEESDTPVLPEADTSVNDDELVEDVTPTFVE
tara:strand:- start:3178 stop:3399 length:222 start_codon:yes stop_codon:yes gene_type:complete